MKLSKKNVKTLILLFSFILALCVYQFVFTPYQEDLEVLEAENETLEIRLNELLAKVRLEPEYREGIKLAQENTKAILNRYGAGNTPEKSIIMLIGLSNATGVSFPSVGFTAEAPVFSSIDAPAPLGLGVHAGHSNLNLSYQSTYQGIKDMMDYIHQYPERMNVESINVLYDQTTGNLSGSMVLNLYSMLGGLKVYEPPVVGDIPLGVDNIFSTIEVPIGSKIPVVNGGEEP